MARSYDMTKGSIWKNILCFSIPIMVSNLIQSTYNAVDMLFVGRFTGTESLAAVSVCGPIMNVMIITLSGMSAGVLVVISSLLGAGENTQARDAAHTSLALYAIMAAVMAGGMVPPLAIALCTTFFKNRFTESERKSGVVNYIMGLSFITEGAIPFAAGDPIHILPPCIVGSAVAGALSMAFKCGLPAPHGGIFVIGVITNPVQYLISVVVGAVIGMIVMSFTKKPLNK